ncbi:PDZ domain-containing protein [Flavobacterium sp. TMP13]|uniref:PDZ domain-containing protein n=1 Tax=Flavobacterium sp. TMP13 TaxID=3425950 RepID=UPI003D76D814
MTKIKTFFCLFFLLSATTTLVAQENFILPKQQDKAIIPFKLINNLVFIPIKVNGVELNFLLDSGVVETILFSLEDKKEVSFFNSEKIKLKGLGSDESIEGLKSTNNILETHGLMSKNHTIFIILDQSFNLAAHIGIPVNGIIGYKLFQDNVVEIDYQKRKIYVYTNDAKVKARKLLKFDKIPITIERSKPYLVADISVNERQRKSKLLIDIGNSDAIWLFQNDSLLLPAKKFEDFLGKGFSGDVLGYRAKIAQFKIGDFEFNKPITAFPDTASVRNVNMVLDRVGSVGGEILYRFTVILDYQKELLYLKKNSNFKKPFQYNHSGIAVQHNGLQWIKETVGLKAPAAAYVAEEESKSKTINFKYEFKLKPIFEIASIRKNSSAEKVGLRSGDIILSINNQSIHRFNLQQINNLLKSEGGKYIVMEVERNNRTLKFKFELIDEL